MTITPEDRAVRIDELERDVGRIARALRDAQNSALADLDGEIGRAAADLEIVASQLNGVKY